MNNATANTESTGRRFFRRTAIATLIGGLMIGTGATVFAQGTPGTPGATGGQHQRDPARMEKHFERRLKHMLSAINASEDQQTRIVGIMKQARTDGQATQQKRRDLHKAMVALLSAPTLDRAEIEHTRAEQMRLADESSRRMTQALADSAEVLTPDQRVALAAQMQKMRSHGHRGHGGPGGPR